jgi:Ni/Fe-hydrogenase subunit HybB-like protein
MVKFERWMALPGALVLAGLAGAVNKLVYGEHALGTTATVPWGSLIAGYVFFAAAATGVGLIGSLGHFSRRPALVALEKPSLFLALTLLVCGFSLIGIELGNPFNLIYALLSPNLHSGIWWMSFLYSIYMALLLVECYFSQVDPANKNLKVVAAVAVANKIAAVCNLGAIFALIATRPFWYGFYFPAYILLTAVLSGAAALAVATRLSAKRAGREADGEVMAVLGKIMLATLILTALANAGKVFHGLASGDAALRAATAALVSGPLALRFWALEIGLGLVVPLALLAGRAAGAERVFRAAAMVLIGVFFMRLDFVMAGQMMPQVVVAGVQHVLMHAYAPTWTEWALTGGAAGAAALLYGLSETRFDLGAGAPAASGGKAGTAPAVES